MFSHDSFKTFARADGLSRQNRFYIEIGAPAIQGFSTDDLYNVHLLCQSANVPGVSFSSNPTRTIGEVHEAPYDRNFSTATLTFYIDKKMKVRKFFDEWMNLIQNPETRTINYRQYFESPEIAVNVLRKDDQPVYKLIMHNAWPKSIGALNVSQESNQIMTLDVTFDYQYYTTTLLEQVNIVSNNNIGLDGSASVTGNTNSTSTLPGVDAIKKVTLPGNTPVMNPINGAISAVNGVVGQIEDTVNTEVNPLMQQFGSFRQTLDGYYNNIYGFQEQISDQLGKYGVKLESNIPASISNTIQQTARGAVFSQVQKVFGGKLGVFF